MTKQAIRQIDVFRGAVRERIDVETSDGAHDLGPIGHVACRIHPTVTGGEMDEWREVIQVSVREAFDADHVRFHGKGAHHRFDPCSLRQAVVICEEDDFAARVSNTPVACGAWPFLRFLHPTNLQMRVSGDRLTQDLNRVIG